MNIGILGCGWLGLPLGAWFVAQGHRVIGSSTTPQKLSLLAEAGIEPVLLGLNPMPQGELDTLLACQVLVVCIPPRASLHGSNFHVEQIKQLCQVLANSSVEAVVYISSTSVYPENGQVATEASQVIAAAPLVIAENLLKLLGKPLTILRCGGLMGYDRIPGKYFIGKQVSTGEIPVNFVHRDDVIGIIEHIISQQHWQHTFNVVAPQHPKRRVIYEQNAIEFGWQAPEFVEPEGAVIFKVVSSDKLVSQTKYRFKYPDPLQFVYQPV